MTRTTLRDELGMLEAERDRTKTENESLKIRVAKLTGANAANERTIMFLNSRIEKLTEFNTTVRDLLHTILGTKETIVRQRADLDAAVNAAQPTATPDGPSVAEVVNSPAHVATIKERIDRIFPRKEKEAAA